MATINIMIQNKEDVVDFVSKAEKLPYVLKLIYDNYCINAKSLMGVFSIGIQKALQLEISEESIEEVISVLKPYVM